MTSSAPRGRRPATLALCSLVCAGVLATAGCAGRFSSANPASPRVRIVDTVLPAGRELPQAGARTLDQQGRYALVPSAGRRNTMAVVRVADRRVLALLRGIQGAAFTGPHEVTVALQPKRLEDHAMSSFDPMCNPGKLVRVDLDAGTVVPVDHGRLRRGETLVPVSANGDGRLVMRRYTAGAYGRHCSAAGLELLDPASGQRTPLP